jgi:ATP synthase I chain
MTTEAQITRQIAVSALVLGSVCALGAYLWGGSMAALGSVIGTALGTINLWALAQLIGRMIDSKASAGSKGPAAVMYVAKAIGFFVLAAFLVSRPWMHHEGFMAGFTAVVIAIAVGGLWGGFDNDNTDSN